MVRTGTRGGPGVPQADGFDGYGDHNVRARKVTFINYIMGIPLEPHNETGGAIRA